MKLTPQIYTLRDLIVDANSTQAEIGGQWVPARPMGLSGLNLGIRFRIAWKVFTGKADAVLWPKGQ